MNKTLKIAILANIASIHTQRWCSALSKRGHLIDLFTHSSEYTDKNAFMQGYAFLSMKKGIKIHVLPFSTPAGYYLNYYRIKSLLKSSQPDLLHAHYASGYGTLGRLCGYHPFIISVWGSDVFSFPEKSFLNRRILNKNLAAADCICSTSSFMAKRVSSLSLNLKGIKVTPFGIDSSQFCPYLKPSPSNEVTVGTVKSLASIYGIDILIRAFARAREILSLKATPYSKPRIKLLIVGDGPQYSSLAALVNHLGLAHLTEFAGDVRHHLVPEYLNRLDIYCAFSRVRESFGVAVLEASSCGIPVVVSDAGGFKEIVKDGITGIICEKENIESAAQAIVKLSLNPDLRNRLGLAGRQLVIDQYSWGESVDIMEDIYWQLLSKYKSTSNLNLD